MRPIDADELLKKAYKRGKWMPILVVNAEDIQEAPTVDTVPVVRCKDCKHRGVEGACPKCFEIYVDDDWYDWCMFDNAKDEGFCDRGERKEENAGL